MRRLWLLALASFLVSASFQQEDETSNARTRLALTRAIVEEGRLTIDTYHEDILDKALFDGHYYCDKAPLLSFLAVPVHAALHGAGVRNARTVAYVTRLLTVSLLTALALPLFGWFLLSRGLPEGVAAWTCAAGWFGTAVLPYATVFFGHDVTLALVVGALAALPARPFPAGLMLGLAVTSDYQALILAAAFGLRELALRRWRGALWMAAGAAGPVVLLLAYHHALFGNPFVVPVRYEVPAAVHNMDAEYDQGLYGTSLPKPRALYLNLLSPGKGLLRLSPFLLLLVLALRPPSAPARRADWLLAWIATPLYVAFIATLPSYHGGFSFGPRLLLPAMPLVLLLLAEALPRLPARYWPAFVIAAAGSAAAYLGAAATLVAIPYAFDRPITQVVLPSLLAGQLAPNAGMLLGLRGTPSLVPIVAMALGLAAAALRGATPQAAARSASPSSPAPS